MKNPDANKTLDFRVPGDLGRRDFSRYTAGPFAVVSMRLQAAKRSESRSALPEQLKRIHQQTVQTSDGQILTGLTEMTPAQKSLFAALDLTLPTPSDLEKPVL